ncbi:hypothetical protein [Streptomyces flavovirens]|uniref:hypothetical protein n=1 Tax=Streptomyces flavovirens TaxID=52258 RepID=UPI0031E83984
MSVPEAASARSRACRTVTAWAVSSQATDTIATRNSSAYTHIATFTRPSHWPMYAV